MFDHIIGEITLTTSFCLYSIWFIPQLILNAKRKSTSGLSLWMHGLLLLGYSADLLYGFGRHMQWQYRATTCIGLISLGVEHYQFFRYGLHDWFKKLSFFLLSIFSAVLLIYAIYNINIDHHNKAYYDLFGMLSNVCWTTFMIPQIIKNFVKKSTHGLSFSFVIISLALSALDTISALMLNWDYPSLIGLPLALLKKIILLTQFVIYRKNKHENILPDCH